MAVMVHVYEESLKKSNIFSKFVGLFTKNEGLLASNTFFYNQR